MKSSSLLRTSIAILLIFLTAGACAAQKEPPMTIDRISVMDSRKLVQTGDALLVCSYDDSRCKDILLEDAIFLSDLESKLPYLAKTQLIIFYCA